jgi:hypothetical protein
MKKLLLIPVLLILASCYNVGNCKDFKTGKFRFDYRSGWCNKNNYFERNDSLEIETWWNTASIRWVNDCRVYFEKITSKNMAEEKQ